jgi:hypothetical protein
MSSRALVQAPVLGYLNAMAAAVDNKLQHTLVVRGPAEDLLFDHFTRLFDGRDDVLVVKERRRAQRRRAVAPVGIDRRRGDRRGRIQPWLVPPELPA